MDFASYLEKETAWLKREVRSDAYANAAYRVAFVHIPPVARGYTGKLLARDWVPLLNESGLDLMLCGHWHRYKHVEPDPEGAAFPIVINSNDTLVEADVSGKRIELTVTKPDGVELDKVAVHPRER